MKIISVEFSKLESFILSFVVEYALARDPEHPSRNSLRDEKPELGSIHAALHFAFLFS